ncbi:succinoglycan biosynthesis protein ExoO [Roseibium sp. TrichSKD4]|uniref:glycosyltransferase family 2 protein n=1 Tax=Roseibium sp. TrichSKD4 TaxID=744980 RepID=UPI0001E563A7|nr:glycosyltransferase family 2 protein [Roseibium sp. TrichSKD4]EFO33033.1 succinoglycan biosynthesis protein ExoO [Roseibium sp. TrichSKD4]
MPIPEVSVIIPCYNTKACVNHAIDSALGQHNHSVEVLVVDDGSTDGTAEFVSKTYETDTRVTLIHFEKNQGPSAARNAALDKAKGTWVGLLDSDDLWHPKRLEVLLAQAPDFDFIADNIMGFDAVAGKQTGPIYDERQTGALTFLDFLHQGREDQHDLGYLQPLMRRSFLETHEFRYNEDVRVGEDLLLNLQILLAGGRALFIDEPLYIYALPVGPLSKVASPYSRSTTDTTMLRHHLQELRSEHLHKFTVQELEALDKRLEDMALMAPIAAFHRARAKGDLVTMLRLALTRGTVRRRILQTLLGRM